MDALIRNIRYGFRILIKNPGFSFIAVIALALGIGSVTSMFSVINSAILRGLPFEESEELMFIKRWDEERRPWNTSIPVLDTLDIRERTTSFESMAGWFTGTVNISFDNNPVRFTGGRISYEWLDLLGIQPFMGRGFLEEEDQPSANPVVILGYNAWQTHYNGDPDILGKVVRINGKSGEIIGIMPRNFSFPQQEEVWIPLMSSLGADQLERGGWSINLMGRLKDGVSQEQAELETSAIIQQLSAEHPNINGNFKTASVEPFAKEMLGDQPVRMMYIMFSMAVFVLLIACANVANLLLARSTLRSKELAIRSSLGASRSSIIVQLLMESLAIAIAGSLGGIAFALWATKTLNSFGDIMQLPFWITFDLDYRVFIVVSIVTIIAGLISGVVPAIKASNVSVTEILKDDTRTGSSLRMGLFSKGLVIAQVAISCVLLLATVLMMRSVVNISNTDLHFDTDSVFTARMGLFEGDYPTAADRHQFFSTLKRNLESRPEVVEVALYGRYRWQTIGVDWTPVAIEGGEYTSDDDYPITTNELISPDYFKTLGIQITGREFNDLDTPDNLPVAIVNEALAETLFPGEDPIGKRFRSEPWPQQRAAAEDPSTLGGPWLTIVGVGPNMAAQGVGNSTGAEGRHFWRPISTEAIGGFMTVVARGRGNPMQLTEVVRNEVVKMDPNLPLYAVATPATLVKEDTAINRVLANIFKVFGLMAVFLASVGIYGIMSFSVNQRIQEFGIRSALGATRNNILILVMRSGFSQFLFGLVIGLAGAYGFAMLLRNFLFEVSQQDFSNYVYVAVLFSAVAFMACFPAARKASRVHPAQALRYE